MVGEQPRVDGATHEFGGADEPGRTGPSSHSPQRADLFGDEMDMQADVPLPS